jgi:hypothetical protein
MATVRMNEAGIRSFFGGNIAGTGPRGRGGGIGAQRARVLANLITAQARVNASGAVVQRRTGDLAASMRPIVREDPLTGRVEVGVGSTIEYSEYLEHGTPPHIIPVVRAGGTVVPIEHPGNEAFEVLKKARDEVMRTWRG